MEIYRKGDYKGFALRIYKGEIGADLLQRCCRENFDEDPEFRPINSSLYSRVFRFSHKQRDYFYKNFFDRNMLEPIKAMFRGNRALRSLKGDQLLLQHGFNVPRCILIGSRRNYNFSVSKAIPNARDLNQFVKEEFISDLDREQIILKRFLIKRLGQVIGQLHSLGISHGDLRWGNILIQRYHWHQLGVWFLDNERTSHYDGNFPCKKRLANLVQINMTLNPVITDTDKMIFLNAYLKENRELVPRRDELAAKIKERTEVRLAKYNH